MHVHMENISVSRQRRAAMCEIRLRAKFGTHLRIIGFEVGGVGGGGGGEEYPRMGGRGRQSNGLIQAIQ